MFLGDRPHPLQRQLSPIKKLARGALQQFLNVYQSLRNILLPSKTCHRSLKNIWVNIFNYSITMAMKETSGSNSICFLSRDLPLFPDPPKPPSHHARNVGWIGCFCWERRLVRGMQEESGARNRKGPSHPHSAASLKAPPPSGKACIFTLPPEDLLKGC